MSFWHKVRRFLVPRPARLDDEAAAVTFLAREFRSRVADFEKRSDDPFTAMTITMATNAHEDREEANIWRGDWNGKG